MSTGKVHTSFSESLLQQDLPGVDVGPQTFDVERVPTQIDQTSTAAGNAGIPRFDFGLTLPFVALSFLTMMFVARL